MALSNRKLDTLKVPSNHKTRFKEYFDGDGLSIRVNKASNIKRWIVQYNLNGKRKMLMLDTYPSMSAREAREEKNRIKRMALKGKDPSIERQEQKIEQVTKSLNTIGYLYNQLKDEMVLHGKWSVTSTRRNGFLWAHLTGLSHVPIAALTKRRARDFLVTIVINGGLIIKK